MIKSRRTSPAFTLVELLCVIAVVAVVAAIAYPVTVRAKLSAKNSTCASNLRQLGTAIALYASQADDRLPNASDGLPPSDPRPRIMPLLAPYGASKELFRCPRDFYMDFDRNQRDYGNTFYDRTGSSYGYDGRSATLQRHLSDGRTSETLLMADRFHFHSDADVSDPLFTVLFRDLHVKLTRWSVRDSIRWPDEAPPPD